MALRPWHKHIPRDDGAGSASMTTWRLTRGIQVNPANPENRGSDNYSQQKAAPFEAAFH